MYYQNKLSRYKYMGEKTIYYFTYIHIICLLTVITRVHLFASSPVTVCFISFLQFTINHGSLLPCL